MNDHAEYENERAHYEESEDARLGIRRILDHGYIQLVETWGSDQAIIEAARMSTGKGFLGWGTSTCKQCGHQLEPHPDFMRSHAKAPALWDVPCSKCGGECEVKPGDEKLLRYLYEHAHATPFEFAGMVVEVKAPIVVFREWHRHRTQSYNEASARYAPLPDENYLPTVDRCMVSGGANKQAGAAAGADVLTEGEATVWLDELADLYEHAERVYQDGLRRGVPKELARLSLPVGRYSKMRAQANLRNWMAFATLRSTAKNPHAQFEIRQYADAVVDLLREHFPRTLELFAGGAR